MGGVPGVLKEVSTGICHDATEERIGKYATITPFLRQSLLCSSKIFANI
jgi:hypothetical protein